MPGPAINPVVKEFGWLGSEIAPLTPAIQPYVKTGVYVSDADGILRAAGVQKGDVIKAINNKTVTDMTSFITITRTLNVRNGFLLDIIRGSQPMYITVRG
jgi:S1-C subfamily serine protease